MLRGRSVLIELKNSHSREVCISVKIDFAQVVEFIPMPQSATGCAKDVVVHRLPPCVFSTVTTGNGYCFHNPNGSQVILPVATESRASGSEGSHRSNVFVRDKFYCWPCRNSAVMKISRFGFAHYVSLDIA